MIADLEALYKKATPGEWRPHRHQDVMAPHGEVLARCYLQHPDGDLEREANQNFIVATHNALPAILTALTKGKAFLAVVESDDYVNETPEYEAFRAAMENL